VYSLGRDGVLWDRSQGLDGVGPFCDLPPHPVDPRGCRGGPVRRLDEDLSALVTLQPGA